MFSISSLTPKPSYSLYKFSDHNIVYKPSYNICLIGGKGEAVLQNVYRGQVEFLAGKLEQDLKYVLVTSDYDYCLENIEKTITVDGKTYELSQNKEIHCQGAILFDVLHQPPLQPPMQYNDNYVRPISPSNTIAYNAATYTLLGVGILIIAHKDLCFFFGLGGILNQAYLMLLKKDIRGIYIVTSALLLLSSVVYLYLSSNPIVSYMIFCLLGFSMGKVSEVLHSK